MPQIPNTWKHFDSSLSIAKLCWKISINIKPFMSETKKIKPMLLIPKLQKRNRESHRVGVKFLPALLGVFTGKKSFRKKYTPNPGKHKQQMNKKCRITVSRPRLNNVWSQISLGCSLLRCGHCTHLSPNLSWHWSYLIPYPEPVWTQLWSGYCQSLTVMAYTVCFWFSLNSLAVPSSSLCSMSMC